MARIAYLILAHNRPKELLETIDVLTAQGDYVSLHYDRNAKASDYKLLSDALATNDRVVLAKRRKCGWGGWSLVGATLDMLRAAEAQFEDASHFYLISGACAPIKPRQYFDTVLDDAPLDHIEAHDLVRSDWIKTGMKEDRYRFRHYFNERTQSALFYRTLDFQRRMGWSRTPPSGLEMKVGSQWWCLRRKTVEAVLEYISTNPAVVTFFKSTWIPDESFFQSVVSRLVPMDQITNRPPTLLMFTDYGMPVTFHEDHLAFLKRQPGLFARKISVTRDGLWAGLVAHYKSKSTLKAQATDPVQHYKMVATAGRTGDRFAQRVWDRSMSVGREKELIIISAKKWDEGDWIRRAVSQCTNIPGVGYLFNTNNAELPNLGGLEGHVDKRAKHRRAVINLLFDTLQTDRLVIGLDPESSDVLDDLARDRCAVTLVYLDRDLDEAYFRGHAERTQQISGDLSDDEWQTVYRALKERFDRTVAELQHPRLFRYVELKEADSPNRRAEVLASALDCDIKTARDIIDAAKVFKED